MRSCFPAALLALLILPGSATGQIAAGGEREVLLRSVGEAAAVEPLEKFLVNKDAAVRRAAVRRLGELATPEAVPLLVKAFDAEPRQIGADVPPGIRRDILDALVQSGTEGAEVMRQLLRSWLLEGPRYEGAYAHIYDSQHFAVLQGGIQSLETSPSVETKTFLREIEENPTLFYTLREEAAVSLLRMEVADLSLSTSAEQAVFLLERIEAEGVLREAGWTGQGRKTAAAVRQATVEELLSELGPAVIEPGLAALRKGEGEDPRRRLGLARIVMESAAGGSDNDIPLSTRSQALATSLAVLEDIPAGDSRSAPSVIDVYRTMIAVADLVAEKELWDRLRKLSTGLSLPGAWRGPVPTQMDLWVPVPEASSFLAGRSRKVATPHGNLVTAWFLHDDAPEKIAAFFEKQMETPPRREGSEGDVTYEYRYVFDLPLPPANISRLLGRGVTVFFSREGFQERAFGETIAAGRTLFRVIK